MSIRFLCGEIMDPLYRRTLRHGITRNNVIWKGLKKIIVSEDRDFYTFFLKLYPFISTNDIFKICLDKCEMISSKSANETDHKINCTIKFLIHAYQNDILDKLTFDVSRVRQVMSNSQNQQAVEELIRIVTTKKIYFDAVDVCVTDPSIKNFNLMKVNSKTIAEKLSYICAHYYNKIRIYNLVKYVRNVSSGKQDPHSIDITDEYYNINKLVNIFNKISAWVPTTILMHPEKKHQEKLVKKIVEIAKECRKLNNYHILMAIYAGLNNIAVSRLTYLWQKQKYNKRIKEIADLMTPIDNFKVYRAELETVILQNSLDDDIQSLKDTQNIPCMPYLGTIISDFQHMLETDPIDISNKRFIRDSLETILIMINRFLKTQILYSIECKHPEINVIFDKLTIWSDKKLYEHSKSIYAPNNKGSRIQKSKSYNSINGSTPKQSSNISKISRDPIESFESFDSVSIESTSSMTDSPTINTEVLPRKVRRIPLKSNKNKDMSQTIGAKLPSPIISPRNYHRSRLMTISDDLDKETSIIRSNDPIKVANRLTRTHRYKSMPIITPNLN